MNKLSYYLTVLVFILISIDSQAQLTIQGTITEKSTGNPLVGATVQVEELNIGVVADNSGHYTLNNVPKGDLIIKFSYVGFNSVYKKVFVSKKSIILNVAMDVLVINGQEVVISGNFTSTQHDNTVKISTIDSKQLSQSIAPSLIEEIAEIPGVNFISKGPGIGTPVIRGLSLSNILFLNNGIPMHNFQFSEDHPYMIDESGVERVEVIKGPASLIYGSGAIGGVINLIGEPIAKEGTISGDATVKYFGNTAGVESNIGIKGNTKGWYWGVRGGINSNKDYIQGNGEFAPNTRFNRNSIKANTGLITKIASFKINYQYNEDRLGISNPPALALVISNGRNNKVWYQHLKNHLVISKTKLFLGDLKLGLDLSYQNNNRKLMGSELTPVLKLVDMTLQTFTYRVKSTYSFNKDLKVIVGVQGMFQKNKNGNAPEHVIPDANVWDFSFYALGQYNLGKKVIFELGTRYSYKYIDVPLQYSSGVDNKKSLLTNADKVEFNGDFSNVSVSAGSTIKLSQQLLFRVNIASAFRTPNIAELTENGLHSTRYEVGNPNLVTQRNTEGDMGFHLHTVHTSIDISAFYNNINNYIYLSPTGDTTSSGDYIFKYKQTPSVLYGGEALIHIHPQPLNWLHLRVSYSYVIGKQQSGGYLPFIPAQRLKFEIKTTKKSYYLLKNIYVLAGVQFVLAQNQPSQFELASPGYSIVNIGIGTGIKVNKQTLNFNLNISNLLDTEYIDHLSTLRDVGILDMGRSVNLKISIPFAVKK